MAKKFPKKLFVKIEADGDTEYCVPGESLEQLAEMGEKIRIGVYQLVETGYVEGVANLVLTKK